MKKLLLPFILFAFSCGNNNQPAIQATQDTEVYYPFSPRMDVDFENGKKQYSNTVLNFWRGYSSGNIKGYRKYFADQVKLVFTDKVVEGNADSVLHIYQERRNLLSTLQAHIEYWKPVYVKEKNQHWVLLWINQEGTGHKKNLDSWSLHQVWKFNAAGKIYSMQEYRSQWDW